MRLGTFGWMLVVTGVVMAGCSASNEVDPDTCARDADCTAEQQCDTATGQCVARDEPKEDRNLMCRTSADCLVTERCHPTARACVQTCVISSDCPDSAKTCAAMSATDTRKVCQCSANALCNQDRQNASLVCSNLDKVCVLKCEADVDCGSGRTCDTATGQCKVKEAPSLTCTDSADCLASELCHPTAKVCVQTCVSSTDCPDSAKTCDVLSDTDSRKVCKCFTDALCNADPGTSELVCSIPDAVCTPKCTADEACGAGYVCDTASGHCKVWGGTDAPCTGEGQSTCYYGTHYCASNTCTALPTPTCMNYTNFANKGDLGTTGPILYDARRVSVTTDTASCGTTTPTRFRIALSVYSSVPLPSSKDELSGFVRVKTDGVPSAGRSYMLSGDYTQSVENPNRAELVVNLCADPEATTLSTGFYFVDGNFLCAQITR